jgi:dCTP deaminase
MSLLSDNEIRQLCIAPLYYGNHPMIEPFSETVSGNGVISYGICSAGYDLRLGPEIFKFRTDCGEIINPKRFGDPEYRRKVFEVCVYKDGDMVIIPPGHYILGSSVEYLRIPRHLKGRCVGKSTNARCLILINTTPAEPEWEGHLTIEIGNVGQLPACVFVGEGIAQMEFEVLSAEPLVSYKDKGGKYQAQRGVTPARVL